MKKVIKSADGSLPLSEISAAVNEELKICVLQPGSDSSLADVQTWCPTGIDLLDLWTYGGVPIGRVWEIYGEPHHGKSALAIQLMVAVQRAGGLSVLLDAEGSVTKSRLDLFGHDPARHLYMNADSVEIGFKAIDTTLETVRVKCKLDIPILFVWDTIAASQTEHEKASDKYGDGMMSKPRLIREGLRRLSLELPRQQAGIVFVNQTMASMDQYSPIDTPGGKSLKFWSTYRIHVKKGGPFQPGGTDNGIISKMKMTKCKLGPPLRTIDLPLSYDKGWDNDFANFNFLNRTDVTEATKAEICRKGSYYYILGFKNFCGGEGPDEIPLYASALDDKIRAYPRLSEYLSHLTRKEWEASYPTSAR